MNYSTYCRVEARAGGVMCSRRELIRELRKIMTKEALGREARDRRHATIRQALEYHDSARELVREYRL